MNRDAGREAFAPSLRLDRLDGPVPRLLGRVAPTTLLSGLHRAIASRRWAWPRWGARGYTMLLPDGHLVITCCRKLAQLSGPPLRASTCDRSACG